MAVMMVPTQRNEIKDLLCVWAIESSNKIVGFVARKPENCLKKLSRVLDENPPKERNEMNFQQKLQKKSFTMVSVVNPTKVVQNTKNRSNEESDICEILTGPFRKSPVLQHGFYAELQDLMSMTDSTNVTNRPKPKRIHRHKFDGKSTESYKRNYTARINNNQNGRAGI